MYPLVPKGKQKRITNPILYLTSFRLPHLQLLLLTQIGSVCIGRGHYQAGQDRMGEMVGRSRERVNKSLQALQDQVLIRIRRRGRKLTNVYRLSKWLWELLTARLYPWDLIPDSVQQLLRFPDPETTPASRHERDRLRRWWRIGQETGLVGESR